MMSSEKVTGLDCHNGKDVEHKSVMFILGESNTRTGPNGRVSTMFVFIGAMT
jgi:hypothetical protein